MTVFPAVSVERVYLVLDGDTFKTYSGEYIRLARIDTPEKGRIRYQDATNRLVNLIYDRYVVVYRKALDVYGRTIADVTCDGRDIASLMEPFSF